ncbi:hypothetical protein IJ096_00760 [Candidatus Saccharibacteria bacterium]|nr:hypothetical protein [Candidatus Saccharibacteria bacterium]
MGWYKFRDGALVKEGVVRQSTQTTLPLIALYEHVFGHFRYSEIPINEVWRPVRLGFIDYKGEHVATTPGEMFSYRFKHSGYGWGRMFSGQPGHLVGYRGNSNDIIIKCSLMTINPGRLYTWAVDKGSLDIEESELKSFYRQVWELDGMMLGRETYPALFE